MITYYVLGFMFSYDLKQVALIRKSHPEWQKGKLNGIGGHIEENETEIRAMMREFAEETGYFEPNWALVGKIIRHFRNSVVTVFMTTGELDKLKTTTDEKIEI